jgi:hypothetical protein
MYNLNQEVSEETGNYFSVGIHQNVALKDVTLETASNGNPYLKFHFEGEKGEQVAHTEWPIDPSKENAEKKIKNFLIRIKHICTKFVPEDAVNINAADFEGFANQVIALLKPNLNKTKVRLKLIYNYKNYVSVPAYVPFIESMAVSEEKTRLKIDPNFDKMEKEEGDNPQLNTGGAQVPAAGLATPPADEGKLPF